MAIDNTIYIKLLSMLGRSVPSVLDDLVLYDTAAQRMVRGKEKAGHELQAFWPSDGSWRRQEEKEKERFEELDADFAYCQVFPDRKYKERLTFTSHAYNVLIESVLHSYPNALQSTDKEVKNELRNVIEGAYKRQAAPVLEDIYALVWEYIQDRFGEVMAEGSKEKGEVLEKIVSILVQLGVEKEQCEAVERQNTVVDAAKYIVWAAKERADTGRHGVDRPVHQAATAVEEKIGRLIKQLEEYAHAHHWEVNSRNGTAINLTNGPYLIEISFDNKKTAMSRTTVAIYESGEDLYIRIQKLNERLPVGTFCLYPGKIGFCFERKTNKESPQLLEDLALLGATMLYNYGEIIHGGKQEVGLDKAKESARRGKTPWEVSTCLS